MTPSRYSTPDEQSSPPAHSAQRALHILFTLRVWLILAILQGLAALAFLVRNESVSGAQFLFGLSRSRFALALITTFILLVFAWLLVRSFRRAREASVAPMLRLLEQDRRCHLALVIAGIIFLLGSYFITLIPEISEPLARSYFDRLSPVVMWLAALGAQTLIALLYLRISGVRTPHPETEAGLDHLSRQRPDMLHLLHLARNPAVLTMAFLATLFIVWSLVAQSVLSQEAQVTGWNSLGVPILETQLLLAWAAGLVMLLFVQRLPADKVHPYDDKGGQRPPKHRIRFSRLDLLISVLLWLLAVILWQSLPITESWFVSEKMAPNNEYYPSSDARGYDVGAQTAIIGEGFKIYNTPHVRRPLHAAYLVALHLIGGQDYERVVFLQILVLALLPVLLFWITKAIQGEWSTSGESSASGRVSGVIVALLIILREANAITVGGNITASHVKTLMADLPATLAVIAFTYVAILFLKRGQARLADGFMLALATGGFLGLAMLIRLETFVLFLPLALIARWVLSHNDKSGPSGVFYHGLHSPRWEQRRNLFRQIAMLLLGIFLAISPWVWRNYQVTGTLYLEGVIYRSNLIAQRFRLVPTATEMPIATSTEIVLPTALPTASPTVAVTLPPQADVTPTIPVTPGPTPGPAAMQTQADILYPPLVSPVASPTDVLYPPLPPQPPAQVTPQPEVQAARFILENPGIVARFVIGHYLNSQLQTVLILPGTFRGLDSFTSFLGHHSLERLWYECCSSLSYIRRLPYWHKWDGRFPAQSFIPILLNLLMVALGVQEAWKRQRWVGLLPLAFNVTYLVFNALFRNSGGRYILPVDWVGVLYFGIGLARATESLVAWLGLCLPRGTKGPATLPDEVAVDAGVPVRAAPSTPRLLHSPRFYLIAVSIFLIGCLPPWVERAFPQRYTEEYQAAMLETLLNSQFLDDAQRTQLQAFLSDGGVILVGRAMYPINVPPYAADLVRFRLAPQPYPRAGFYLIGQYNSMMSIPIERSLFAQKRLRYFPNAVDVLAIGCPPEDLLLVGIFAPSSTVPRPSSLVHSPSSVSLETVITRYPYPSVLSCPLPTPDTLTGGN